MALFGRKSREEALDDAARIAEGKGIAGKLTRGFLGKEAMGQMQASVQAAQNAQYASQVAAAGVQMTPAVVAGIQDTGKLVNNDPILVLTVNVESTGQQITMETLVSKVQIPRPGDRIGLLPNPAAPGTFVYGGPMLG